MLAMDLYLSYTNPSIWSYTWVVISVLSVFDKYISDLFHHNLTDYAKKYWHKTLEAKPSMTQFCVIYHSVS